MLAQLTNELRKLENQVRFIRAVIAKQLVISNRKKADVIADLVAQSYDRFPPKKARKGDVRLVGMRKLMLKIYRRRRAMSLGRGGTLRHSRRATRTLTTFSA